MTTEKDAQDNGCTRNSDDTLNSPNGDKKYVTLTGDTGQLLVKELGGNDVYRPYDPKND